MLCAIRSFSRLSRAYGHYFNGCLVTLFILPFQTLQRAFVLLYIHKEISIVKDSRRKTCTRVLNALITGRIFKPYKMYCIINYDENLRQPFWLLNSFSKRFLLRSYSKLFLQCVHIYYLIRNYNISY